MSVVQAVRTAGMTVARRVRRRSQGTAVVLTYHRVAHLPLDPLELAITPERFEAHVEALSQRYRIVTAGELLIRMDAGRRIPEDAVVITLDDGYAECATVVRDILGRHGAVATAFVCTGYLDGSREYWVDMLERVLLQTGALPERFRLATGGAVFYDVPVPSEERRRDAAGLARYRSWKARFGADDWRTETFLDVLDRLKPVPEPERSDAVRAFASEIGIDVSQVRADRRMLSADEVSSLHAGGIVEIGAHTTMHAALTAGDEPSRIASVRDCRAELTRLCGGDAPVAFAYPYGTTDTFDSASERIVERAGFLGAFTTTLGGFIPWGSVAASSPRFRLPRTHVADIPADDLVALVDKRLGR